MNNNLNEVIELARQPLIDKLEKALEINRDLVEALRIIAKYPGAKYNVQAVARQAISKAKGDSR